MSNCPLAPSLQEQFNLIWSAIERLKTIDQNIVGVQKMLAEDHNKLVEMQVKLIETMQDVLKITEEFVENSDEPKETP